MTYTGAAQHFSDSTVPLGGGPTVELGTAPLVGFAPSAPVLPTGRSGDVVAGRYTLEKLLGVGGMGAVWSAREESTGTPVALKELTAGHLDAARAEAEAARGVEHPSVVTIHEVVQHAELPWIVMELVAGRSLGHQIRHEGRLPADTFRHVATQLLDAVSAVHATGVVHRDITPGNILYGDDARIVLIDFGLAHPWQTPPTARELHGSPPYVAPETIRNGTFGPAADLFAVGATLYAAAEGRRPFHAPTTAGTLKALLDAPVPAVRHAGEFEPLLRGLLRKDPSDRLTGAQARSLLA
jgi:serine/threonine protein kinase